MLGGDFLRKTGMNLNDADLVTDGGARRVPLCHRVSIGVALMEMKRTEGC